jgi:hypothetical protein
MILLLALITMYLATPAAVPAETINLEELLRLTEKLPYNGTPTVFGALFGSNSHKWWSVFAFQDVLSLPAFPASNHGLEIAEKNGYLIPFLEFSNLDPNDLKQLAIELRFTGTKK